MSGWEYNPSGKLEVVNMDRGPIGNAMHQMIEELSATFTAPLEYMRDYAESDVRATYGMYSSFSCEGDIIVDLADSGPFKVHDDNAIDGEIVPERKAITGE